MSGDGGEILDLDYGLMHRFAGNHDQNAAELLNWVAADPGYAERYLQTHGNVNFGTYQALKTVLAGRTAAGTSFAARSQQTAWSLRGSAAGTQAVDAASGADFASGAATLPRTV